MLLTLAPISSTPAAVAGVAIRAMELGVARTGLRLCSRANATVKRLKAVAWCAAPKEGGTYVIRVVTPKATCTKGNVIHLLKPHKTLCKGTVGGNGSSKFL